MKEDNGKKRAKVANREGKNDGDVTPVHRPKLKHFVVVIMLFVFVVILLKVPTEAYVDSVTAIFKRHGFSKTVFVEVAWNTRWYIGRFRGPLTDEEMIAYLSKHRAGFDQLATDYYDEIAKSRSVGKANERLLEQLRSLGLWQIEPGGASFQENLGKDAPVFAATGVSFKLLDHGAYPWWSFGRKYIKSYLYMPVIPPHPKRSSDPLERILNTRDYRLEASTDRPAKPILDYACALRQVDSHWFVRACGAETFFDKP